MPETALNASTADGNKFINDYSPKRQLHSGAWPLRDFQNYGESYDVECRYVTRVSTENSEDYPRCWPDNPFTQADLLDTEEYQIQELMFRIRKTLSIPYRESLANRLVTLFGDAKEEDVDSVGIALDSLRGFYNFLRLNIDLKCPIISLTPDSTIYASWKGEQNRVFSVHFLSNGDVRFVIFKPNDRHPEKQVRISGTATTDTLMETVTPDGLMDWIAE